MSGDLLNMLFLHQPLCLGQLYWSMCTAVIFCSRYEEPVLMTWEQYRYLK